MVVSNVYGSQQGIEVCFNEYTRITSGCILLASVFQISYFRDKKTQQQIVSNVNKKEKKFGIMFN